MSACVFCNANVTSRQHALLNSVVDVVIRTIDILLHFIFHSRPSTFALKIIILHTQ